MRKVKGDLLDMFDNGDFDVIVHGCNCHHAMNGGIAALIAQRYPEAQIQDNKTKFGDENKLGTIGPVLITGWLSVFFPWWFKRKYVVNAYTQFNPGMDGNLDAIGYAFGALDLEAEDYGMRNMRIGIPAIGCGIAGLEWADVEPIIDEVCGLNITLVEFEPN